MLEQQSSGQTAVVPPAFVSVSGWLKWRSDEGQRPFNARRDTKGTTLGFESELWKAAMVGVYGPDWWEQLETQEVA